MIPTTSPQPLAVEAGEASPAEAIPRKTAATALGLLALGLLTPADYGFGTVALLAHLGALAVLAAVLLGVTLPVGDQERLPGGLAAAAAFVAWWSLGVNLRSVFLVAAAVVLVREAIRQRATGPISPGLAWRSGWRRRILVIGAVLAALVLSSGYWDYGYIAHTSTRIGDYEYSQTSTTEPTESARSRGIAGVPSAVLGLCLLACAWRGALGHASVRLALVVGTAGLVAWGIWTHLGDHARAEASRVGSYGIPVEGGGAIGFALCALLMSVGALLLLVRPPREDAVPSPG